MSTSESNSVNRSAILSAYLVVYNTTQALGWCYILILISLALIDGKGAVEIYRDAGRFTRFFQLASFLEVLHAALGLVRSDPLMAFMQWGGRTHVLLAILHGVPGAQSYVFGPVMIGAWAVSEVIRYPWYALSAIGACPYALTWLRYTMFIPLYPVGVVGEMGLMWMALPTIQSLGYGSIRLPNAANLGFEYAVFIKVLLLVYPLLLWHLYSSLLRQRSKRLSGGRRSKAD